jgi:hypothetical protein
METSKKEKKPLEPRVQISIHDQPYWQNALNNVPRFTKIAVITDPQRLCLEWPDKYHIRRFNLTSCLGGSLVDPVSLSPLVEYQVKRVGTLLRLVPRHAGKFVTEPITVKKMLDSAKAVLPIEDAERVSQLLLFALGQPENVETLVSDDQVKYLLDSVVKCDTDSNLNHLVGRYLDIVFDWFRWRQLGVEPHICYLSRFIDNLPKRFANHPGFLKNVQVFASDLRQGKNILAYYVTGLLSYSEIERWIRITDQKIAKRIEFQSKKGSYWISAHEFIRERKELYQECGSHVDYPSDGHQKRVYEFFARQGLVTRNRLRPPTTSARPHPPPPPQGYTLNLARYHENMIVEILSRLVELSKKTACKIQGSIMASQEPVMSSQTLLMVFLADTEIAVLDHPLDTAEESLIEPLSEHALNLLPGADLPDIKKLKDKGRYLPLVFLRKIHFWTIGDLAEVLQCLYMRTEPMARLNFMATRQRKEDSVLGYRRVSKLQEEVPFPKLLIEGDFRGFSRVCDLILKSTTLLRGNRKRPISGIFHPVHQTLLRVPRYIPFQECGYRRTIIQTVLTLTEVGRRFGLIFKEWLEGKYGVENPDQASSVVFFPAGSNTIPPGAYVFESIADLLAKRRELPMMRSIFCAKGKVKTFEEFYFIFLSTFKKVYLEADKRDHVARLFA